MKSFFFFHLKLSSFQKVFYNQQNETKFKKKLNRKTIREKKFQQKLHKLETQPIFDLLIYEKNVQFAKSVNGKQKKKTESNWDTVHVI